MNDNLTEDKGSTRSDIHKEGRNNWTLGWANKEDAGKTHQGKHTRNVK